MHWQEAESGGVAQAFMSALTTALALRLRRSLYVCPVPTNTMGWPVMYVMEMAAPTYRKREVLNQGSFHKNLKLKEDSNSHTLSSMVSNLVRTMPSISLGLSVLEWSARAWLNFTYKNAVNIHVLQTEICVMNVRTGFWHRLPTFK